MWARAGPHTARITEDHYKRLTPDQVRGVVWMGTRLDHP